MVAGSFRVICAQAGMTACTRLPVGSIRSSEPAWVMFRRLVEEVASLAAVEGVVLAADAVDGVIGFADELAPSSTSSLYTDLIEGRRTELEALHGLVVRRSHAHGLQAPMSEAVYALFAPHLSATAGAPS
jgi:2-dehydropantoate 2-reductase